MLGFVLQHRPRNSKSGCTDCQVYCTGSAAFLRRPSIPSSRTVLSDHHPRKRRQQLNYRLDPIATTHDRPGGQTGTGTETAPITHSLEPSILQSLTKKNDESNATHIEIQPQTQSQTQIQTQIQTHIQFNPTQKKSRNPTNLKKLRRGFLIAGSTSAAARNTTPSRTDSR